MTDLSAQHVAITLRGQFAERVALSKNPAPDQPLIILQGNQQITVAAGDLHSFVAAIRFLSPGNIA